jgi:hypothetical protein
VGQNGLFSIGFYVDEKYKTRKFLDLNNPPEFDNTTFIWDFRGYTSGLHKIAVGALDIQNKLGYHIIQVNVQHQPPPPPPLLPEIEVLDINAYRRENKFQINLEVKNQGGAEAKDVHLQILMEGFQPISKTLGQLQYRADWDPVHRHAFMNIDIGDMTAGHIQHLNFEAVPVLLYPSPPNPQIGSYITASWKLTSGEKRERIVKLPIGKTGGGQSLQYAHTWAAKRADYLLITDPYRLFAIHNPNYYDGPSPARDAVNEMLSSMAELAKYKQGVLGYAYKTDRYQIEKLINPNGHWAKQLHTNFSRDLGGYVLIVGEVEIIPSFYTSGWNLIWVGVPKKDDKVWYTDTGYADVTDGGYGGGWRPELNVGRIIGNGPADLTRVIRRSIDVHLGTVDFDRSHSLAVSGTGNWEGSMVDTVDVHHSLMSYHLGTDAYKIHWKDHSGQELQEFVNHASGRDLIFINAHGNPDSIEQISTGSLPANVFGSTAPIVFVDACLTGSYEDHRLYGCGDDNVAEHFFDRGAGVYIGATEITEGNSYMGKYLFKNFISDLRHPIGKRLTAAEKFIWGRWGLDYQKQWVCAVNLYGDPKFGHSTSTLKRSSTTKSAPAKAADPAGSLEVVIPDYEVSTYDGFDHVEIPEETLVLEDGQPEVPRYLVEAYYPGGYEIQEVTLTEKSGQVLDTGLNLPIHQGRAYSPHNDQKAGGSEESEGWFPQLDYNWAVYDDPNGGSKLAITIYPFHYNVQTTDIEFYKNFGFDIDYIISEVSITSLSTDKSEYLPGEPVNIDFSISGSEEPQDIVVNVIIRLSDLTGDASFTAVWNTSGFDPNFYYVEATLRDTAGHLLDKKGHIFHLGVYSGEITNFSTEPNYVEMGRETQISLTFENTGSMTVNGIAFIKVYDANGQLEEQFEDTIVDLSASTSASFNYVWIPLKTESYSLVAYVLYAGDSTEPVVLDLNQCSNGAFTCDINQDCYVNLDDFAGLASYWFSDGCYAPLFCDGADVDQSGSVDLTDLSIIISQWLWCNNPSDIQCDL